MKTFLVIALALVGTSMARPGGYTGIGGVYKNMKLGSETMAMAKKASKMAVDIFNDESLTLGDEDRNAREAQVYIPTFYTAHAPAQLADDALPDLVRNNRATSNTNSQYQIIPSYADQYRPSNPQIYY